MREELLQILEASPWHHHVEDDGEIRIAFVSEEAAWEGRVWLEEELGYLVFYGVCPVNASETRRARVSEICTRINCGLPAGCFELNFDSGECRVRTGLNLGEAEFDPLQIETALETNFALMSQYLPAILQAIYTEFPLTEILEAIENPEEGEEEGEA